MRHRNVLIIQILASLFISHNAFSEAISGSVTDKNTGIAVKGATVKLKSTRKQVLTDSLGLFSFASTGNAYTPQKIIKDIAPALNGATIRFAISSPQQVMVEQFNLSGRKAHASLCRQLDPGEYSFDLSKIVQPAAGLYIVKFTVGKNSVYSKTSSIKTSSLSRKPFPNAISFENSVGIFSLSKHASVIDTLFVSHPKFVTALQPVEAGVFNYTIRLDSVHKDMSISLLKSIPSDGFSRSAIHSGMKSDQIGLLTEFRDTVEYICDSVKYIIKPRDERATVSINNQIVSNVDSGSAWFKLKSGNSFDTVSFKISAGNSSNFKNYKIITFRKPDATSSITALSLSTGTPLPGFVADSSRYIAIVDTSTDAVRIKITPKSKVATVSIAHCPVQMDSFSAPISIAAGRNTIIAVITAQNGITKDTVTISIVRGLTFPDLYLTCDHTISKITFPYIMIRNIVIDTNATLSVAPGVAIFADSGKYFEVRGTLVMTGTAGDTIKISAIDTTRPWGFINYLPRAKRASFNQQQEYTGGCIVRYCALDNGGNGASPSLPQNTHVIFAKIPLSISHVLIRDCVSGGILMDYSGNFFSCVDSTTIERTRNSSALEINCNIPPYTPSGSCKLTSVIVRNNQWYGIQCSLADISMTDCTADNNFVGINASAASSFISHCIISNNASFGISVVSNSSTIGSGFAPNGLITDCEIISNGKTTSGEPSGGIWASGVKIHRCKIQNNRCRAASAGVITLYGNVIADSNVITDNVSSTGIIRLQDTYDTLAYNLISNNATEAPASDSANRAAIVIEAASNSAIHHNTIINSKCQFEISNVDFLQSVNFNALNNFWGKTARDDIAQRIYDWDDNDTKGKVFFEPFLTSQDPAVPAAPQ
jgi:hypothetical protein